VPVIACACGGWGERGTADVTLSERNPPVFQLLSVREAADALHLHVSTVRRIIRAGGLPVVRLGRAIRVHPRDLEKFVDERRFAAVISALRFGSWTKIERAWQKYESGD
jgi:excisionase family DNA binding protein